MSILLCSIALAGILSGVANADSISPMEMRFRQLGKNAPWKLVGTKEVGFKTFHPQGMTAVEERLFLSSVEVVDRKADKGTGHLFEMDRNGNLLRQTTLGEGEIYHPGGMDYDGAHLWVPVAAYRPDSASIIYSVDPDTLQEREVFRFADHLGALSHFPDKNMLLAVSWGSRRFYRWKTELRDGQWIVPDPAHPVMQPNGGHYIDYQDVQRIPGTPYMLCSGLQGYAQPDNKLAGLRLGGIDLVHVEELCAHHQIPVPVRPPAAPAWTQNPFYVEIHEDGLRFIFIPEDNISVIHVFEIGGLSDTP